MQSLAKNSIYNIINKCQRLVFPLVSSVYVSRIILPEGVGKVSAAQNIVSYFVLIASLGIPVYGVKKIAECGGDDQKRGRIFSELFVINSASSVFCSLLYLVVVLSFGYFQSRIAISLIAGILLFANFFSVEWFYQGTENYKYLMCRGTVATALALLVTFLFVKKESDYLIYALICTLYTVIPYFVDAGLLIKKHCLKFSDIEIRYHLKPIFILLASSVAIEIYVLTDVTMLAFIKGDEAVGYYTNAMKVVAVLRTLIAAVCAVYLPKLSFYYSKGETESFLKLAKKGIGILTTLAVPAAVGLVVVSDVLIPIFFGKAFVPSSLTAKILALSVITVTLSNFTGYQILTVINKEKHVLISTIIGAAVNVILNIFLISRLSYNGAAIASVITEACVSVYQIVVVRHCKIRIFEKRVFLSAIISAVTMVALLLLVNRFVVSSIVLLIVDVFIGAFTYFLVCFLTGNTVVRKIITNRRVDDDQS